jgi:hypothetical protein
MPFSLFTIIPSRKILTSDLSLESQIAKLKRNQERRIDRKNKKIAKEGGELLVASPSVKTETTRKCGNCGDVGHMSTFHLRLSVSMMTDLL